MDGRAVMKKIITAVLAVVLLITFSSHLDASRLRPPSSGEPKAKPEKTAKEDKKSSKKDKKDKQELESDPTINSIIILLTEGKIAEARKLADRIGQKLSGMSEVQKAFLIAYAKIQVGEWSDAVKYLKECEGNYPVMADYVDYFLAESLKRSGNDDAATAKYAEFKKNYPTSIWQSGRDVQVYPPTARGETPPHEMKITCTGSAENADSEIANARSAVLSGYFGEGLSCLEKIYENARLSESLRDQALDALIEGFWKKRDYNKATTYLEHQMKKEGGNPPVSFLQKLATAYSRSNQFDAALKVHRQIVDTFPSTSYATLSRYKIAFILMDAGRFADAIPAYEEYLAKGGPKREEARWAVAWCYWRLKDYVKAADAFSDMAAMGKEWRTRARFWTARSLDGMKKHDDANAIYADIADNERFTYYGFVSLERLRRNDKKRTESIESTWYVGGEPVEAAKSEPVNEKKDATKVTHWDKVKELDRLGISQLVGAEIDAAKAAKENTDIDNIALLEIERRNGDFHRSYVQAISTWGSMMDELPRGNGMRRIAWISYYPLAYESYVRHYGKRFGVEPELICAIMREESTFRPSVVSPAEAVGLMQIIPPTAYRLAKELKEDGFVVDELTNPMVNIKFGTWYLNQLLKMFDGEKIYAIASYNAGEDAVERWRKNSGNVDIEEFIEEIPYTETNKYVKKVLKSYWIYQRLYRG